MLPWESRRERRKGRARRRPDLAALERLEGRELLAYTPLGYSLPDLVVQGFTGPAASWGGPLTVTVDVKNLGASTLIEPLALLPGSTSTADAPATTVVVYASPRRNSFRGEVPIGVIDVPSLRQNDIRQISQTLTLPERPPGFPGDGGKIFVHFQINPTQTRGVVETDYTNNISKTSPVQIQAPFPQLEAVGLDVPPFMQPGDTIQPNIHVANLGPADTLPQGPVTVALVASVDRKFGPGSSVVALYQVDNISAISTAPSQNRVFGEATLDVPNNVVTISGAPVTLPVRPRNYFLGVVVDPSNTIKELGKIGNVNARTHTFTLIQHVGPPLRALPPAGVLTAGGGANNQPFPFPVTSSIIIGNPISTTPPSQFP